MKKVIITFNPDGAVTWEPMPEDVVFNPEKQEEKPEPDYSHLVGKWVRCYADARGLNLPVGKWSYVKGYDYQGDLIFEIEGSSSKFGWRRPEDTFDLTDPRDSNPLEPIETIIPFDYDRWKSGDYVRVVNGRGQEVKQLTEFDCTNDFPMIGVVESKWESFKKSGAYFINNSSLSSLHLVVLQTLQE